MLFSTRRSAAALGAAVLLSLGLAACGGGGGSSGGGEAAGNVLRRGTASEPPSLDPHLAQGNSSSPIIDDLFIGLMTADAKGETVGGLSEKQEASADGLTWTFTLRPNLQWSDGKPITAQDVVWTFQRLMKPETGARYASNLYMIKGARPVNTGKAPVEALGVRATGPNTVVFTLERRTPYFLRILGSNATVILPRHAVEAGGRGWTKPGSIVGSGAFTLAEWVPNTRIVLKKNPRFYDAASVRLDGVVYVPTDDTGALVKRYRAGELDMVLNFPPEQAEFLKKELGDQVRVNTNYGLYYFLFNTRQAPFDDVRVRKALSIAVDKEGLAGQILRGEAKAAWTLVPEDISDYTHKPSPDAARPLAQRIEEAKGLLAQAGYGPAKPLPVTLRYDTKEESRQIAVAIGSMWEKIGVKPTLTASDFRAITTDARSGRFQVIRYQWFAPYDDPITFLKLVGGRSATNLTGYSNPRYDGMLAAADEQTDPARRMAMLAEAEALAMADYPALPIYFTTARRLVSPRVGGWSDFPGGLVQSRYLSVK